MRNDTAFEAEPLLVSIKQTRVILGGIAHSTVYDLINAGKLKTAKIGGRRLVRHDSIKSLIEESAS